MHPFFDLPPSLDNAILDLSPTAYWPLNDGGSPLRDVARGWNASVTGSPTYGVAESPPIGLGVTWPSGTAYGATATSIPTPTSSISVMAFISTTNATAAIRAAIGRGATSNYSFYLGLNTSHSAVFQLYQGSTAAHGLVGCGTAAAVNDGVTRMIVGTFDGTTINGYRQGRGLPFLAASSTSLTGSWKKDSTAAMYVGDIDGLAHMIGSEWHVAYWCDRVLTAAECRHIGAIAFGG